MAEVAKNITFEYSSYFLQDITEGNGIKRQGSGKNIKCFELQVKQ